MPLVSIIMTFRNGMPWILDAVESVLAQSCTDWELVLVDDGSTDGSGEEISSRWGSHAGLRLLRNRATGRGNALNLAVEVAHGTWIANLDADDLFHPEKLRAQLSVAPSGEKKALLFTRTIIIGEQKDVSWPPIGDDCSYRDVSRGMVRSNYVTHSSMLMRRDFLLELGGYDASRKSQFDYELWLRAIFCGGKILQLSAPLTAHRIHARQSFEARARLQYVWANLNLQAQFAPNLNAKPLDYAFIFAKFLFGLTPRAMRRIIWKIRSP